MSFVVELGRGGESMKMWGLGLKDALCTVWEWRIIKTGRCTVKLLFFGAMLDPRLIFGLFGTFGFWRNVPRFF